MAVASSALSYQRSIAPAVRPSNVSSFQREIAPARRASSVASFQRTIVSDRRASNTVSYQRGITSSIRASTIVSFERSNPIRTASGKVRVKQITFDTVLPLPEFTKVALPGPFGLAGAICSVSDVTGGPALVYSDGINWRRLSDRTIVN